MKKHAESLAKVASTDLVKKAGELRQDVSDLKRGIRAGDVQNYKMLGNKKKELARVLSRISREERTK